MKATQFKAFKNNMAYQLVGSPEIEQLKEEPITQFRGTLSEVAK